MIKYYLQGGVILEFTGHRNVSKHDGSTSSSWFSYHCGYCDSDVSGAVLAEHGNAKWLMCTKCASPSVLSYDGYIRPGSSFGPSIEGLPKEVSDAYDEARNCFSVNSFTAVELLCRKILMHVAVDKGATEGESFATYLTFLETAGYITPPMKAWVDLIRRHGNDSTHKIAAPDKERAQGTLMFTAELLRIIYEMDFLANRYINRTP